MPEATSVGALLDLSASRHGDRAAVSWKQGDEWTKLTHAELREKVRALAVGLVALGVEPGERVCILANTRPEWTYLAYATWLAGGVVVPICPPNSPEECEWVAGTSEAAVVICEDEAQLDKIRQVREGLPNLRTLVLIDGEADDATSVSGFATGDESEIDARTQAVTPEDPLLIIYTSGTTGPPKGCVLTHSNGLALCDMVDELGTVKAGDVSYLYLPLAHVFAQLVQISGLYIGAQLAFFGGDTKRIVPELQEVKPDYFASVPRIFEKVYAQATGMLQQATPEQREQFDQAIKLGLKVREAEVHGEDVPDELRKPFEQADEAIFKNVRAIFGGRMRESTTGAAPIAREILEFFFACGCAVMEGYGMTETTGVGTTNTRAEHRFGSVGRPLPGIQIRIAEEDGEILMRGPNIFRGYWRNDEATREVLDDEGWMHTGDLGSVDDDGYLFITGRKKDIIITAGGKNLTPANIENDLKQSRWISQAVMYGDRRPYPVVLVTLDPEEAPALAQELGIDDADPAKLAEDPRVHERVQGILDEVNRNYAQVEQVKKFTILDHDLS